MNINLETICQWSAPVRVQTKMGPRILRKAKPNAAFSAAWQNGGKDALKAAGIGWSKDARTGEWEVCWWGQVPAEEIAQAKAAVEASRAADADIEIPAPHGCEYLGYQKAGINYALHRPATLIGDEMGLGKTIQAVGVINADQKIARVLVICPASLKLNWYRELKKWLVRPLSVGIADSKVFPTTDIVILNYDVAHKYGGKLSFYWDLIVIDECHRLKNPEARRTKAILGYKPTKKKEAQGEKPSSGVPARRKLLLTGTPICNRPIELFPLINYLDPTRWNNFFKFANRYTGAHNNGWGWDFSGSKNEAELQEILRSTIMVRRLKSEVLTELPAKRRQVIEIPADSDDARQAISFERKATEAAGVDMAEFKARLELAKASDDPKEYAAAVEALRGRVNKKNEDLFRARHMVALAKVPYVIEHIKDALEEEDDKKIVVFAHHLDVIQQISAAFPGCAVMTGESNTQQRQAMVDRFQKDPACKVIVGGIFVMGVGWTLVASSHVVMAELDWVPGNVTQCEDRTHRIGQRECVLVQHLVLEGSVDVDVARALVDKQEVIDRVLDNRTPASCGQPVLVSGASDAGEMRAAGEVRFNETAEPVVPVRGITAKRSELIAKAAKLTPENIKSIHTALQMLAGVCDGAYKRDECGYNGCDARIGHDLAGRLFLTPLQAALGQKIIRKYHRQLGGSILEAAGIMLKKDE